MKKTSTISAIIIYLSMFIITSSCNTGVNNQIIRDTIYIDSNRLSNINSIKEEIVYADTPNILDKKYYTTADSVIIIAQPFDTLIYLKEYYNSIITFFPELYAPPILSPQQTMRRGTVYVNFINNNGEEDNISFGSEVGQDSYYTLYAYFLQKKNGISKHEVMRKKLRELFYTVNSIFANIENGGTAYGHNQRRIPAFVEFAIYQRDLYNSDVNIYNGKKKFIKWFREIIDAEIKQDESLLPKEAKEKKQKLYNKLSKIEALITNQFYLLQAENFLTDNYNPLWS